MGMNYYDDVLPLLEEGKKFRRPGWHKDVFLYYIPGHKLSAGLGYGYGEYIGEPRFEGTVVMRTALNTLQVGYKPINGDVDNTDWEEIK
ncbi:hypothetical protein Blue_010 [Bacillus phage Deep Blue]|uniref:Thoeris anti-defense 2-like domain-containing protein n=1 Tax=Bacillus phage Deep Blue TaxID=1792245 RepID=A0A140HLH1_9CAUD|nr:hypothetical protein Blue_010 [Bacillus phage Deep Blue]AMO25833.1 hypothetical protein Blue_010 [Bacillus phage Deep Blue]